MRETIVACMHLNNQRKNELVNLNKSEEVCKRIEIGKTDIMNGWT